MCFNISVWKNLGNRYSRTSVRSIIYVYYSNVLSECLSLKWLALTYLAVLKFWMGAGVQWENFQSGKRKYPRYYTTWQNGWCGLNLKIFNHPITLNLVPLCTGKKPLFDQTSVFSLDGVARSASEINLATSAEFTAAYVDCTLVDPRKWSQ